MHIQPKSAAFTLLLGALVALPSFAIDMNLPALGPIGASLGISAGRAGLTMSLFMLGFAIGPLIAGPLSDGIGRKPVVLAALGLFTAASLGCAVAGGLATLLALRVVEGMGAGAAMVLAFSITRDHFEGSAGQAKLSYVASVMLVVPMLAPAVGTLLLQVCGWRSIFGVLVFVGGGLLTVFGFCFRESAQPTGSVRLTPGGIVRDYARVLRHPVCRSYIVVNAAAFGALFAYVSGSSLFFIDALGWSRDDYSMVFAATSFAIMSGAFLSGQLSAKRMMTNGLLAAGVTMAVVSGTMLLIAIRCGWTWVPGLLLVIVASNLAFGLISPNAMHAAMQPMPRSAGTVSAIAGSLQVLVGSVSSAYVVSHSGTRPGLAMAMAMTLCSAIAWLFYVVLARPAASPRVVPRAKSAGVVLAYRDGERD
jgi:DHA1 family bicyclomycin/chloramphenicol resistance-like MFS transporter